MSGSAKRVCVQCGTEFPADAPWCPKCGLLEQSTIKMKAPCAKCGADLLKDAVFCIECGTKQERRLDASLTRLASSVSQLTETVSELNEQVPKIGHVRVKRVELFECLDCHKPFPESSIIKCYECGRLICEQCAGPTFSLGVCPPCEEVFEAEEDYYNWA